VTEEERVDPRILQLKLLSDLSKSVVELHTSFDGLVKLTASMVEEGIVEPLSPRTVDSAGVVVHPPLWGQGRFWFGVKITNDGPQSVYVVVNTGKGFPQGQELKPEETWGVQFKTAVIEDLRLYTESGTATVRIRGER